VPRKGITVPRILVADDNTNIQKMVTLAFQERGVDVVAVGNGEAAVRKIPDANPDLVLADVFMPVRNGYEVCEFVKKDSRFAHVPVILLVGAFDPLDEKEARRVGADGVLKKPFVPPDPLIAMVMSALEKNPKVMAEWAKQKEAAAAAAAPPPMPALESPAKAEPKPLPHFPEPTPEEAAVIYGFGKGLRGMDAEEPEAREEAPAPAAPKVVAKSSEKEDDHKIAAPAKNTVTGMDFGDDEMDAMETATDRRRANTDFEIPENTGADPIYSYGRDFEPITFPSEKDVPPKHVKEDASQPDAIAAEEPAAAAKAEEFVEAAAPAVEVVAKQEESTDWDIRPASEVVSETPSYTEARAAAAPVEEAKPVELISAEVAQEEAPAPFSFAPKFSEPVVEEAAIVVAQKSLPERVFDAPREFESAPAVAASIEAPVAETDHKTDSQESTSRGGWMDMMSPVPSQPAASSHWMESLGASEQHTQASEKPLEVEATAHSSEPETVEPAPVAASYDAEPEAVTETPSEISAQAEDVTAAAPAFEHDSPAAHASTSDWSDQLPSAPAIDLGSSFNTEPRSFGESIPQFGSTSYHFASNETASGHENFATAEKEEFAAAESPSDLEVSPADAARDDSAHEPTEPLYVSEQVPAPESEVSQPEPVEEHEPVPAFAESKDAFVDPAPSFFAASESVATVQEDYTERIPTLPPTSRESLSDIPFLVPPASRETHATNGHSDHASNGSDQVVDDVVRKVLEKLQPQLQEMLSQGMKPLLENLVQNELQKKDR
jgi:CheY-like chemotaxis protein